MVSWAGMRGVVTLAAVFLLPAETPAARALLAPGRVRRGGRHAADPGPDAAVAGAPARPARPGPGRGRAAGGLAGHRRPRAPASTGWRRCARRTTRRRSSTSCASAPSGGPTRSGSGSAARTTSSSRRRRPTGGCALQMLAAERGVGARRRATPGPYDDEVLRAALTALDLEESMLDRIEDAAARVDDELEAHRSAPATASTCATRRASLAAAHARGLRGVPARRHPLGAPAAVPDLRARRLLRLLDRQARDRALPRDRAPGDAQHRARRGLALVLRRRPRRLSRCRLVAGTAVTDEDRSDTDGHKARDGGGNRAKERSGGPRGTAASADYN